MKTKLILCLMIVFQAGGVFSQNMNNIQMPGLLNGNARKTIHIPDVLGCKTLKCDFHMHTVFSDGIVWPTVRVDEAWQEGLDAIAITDHCKWWELHTKLYENGELMVTIRDQNKKYKVSNLFTKGTENLTVSIPVK